MSAAEVVLFIIVCAGSLAIIQPDEDNDNKRRSNDASVDGGSSEP